MDENLTEKTACACEILPEDWDLIICRCEEVTRGEILEAINQGATTVEEIKRRTRAGMGLCQSKTCCRSVQKLIAEATGQTISTIFPFTSRPPVRPVSLSVLANLTEHEVEK